MQKPFQILLVEDNPGDVELARMILEDSGLAHHLNVTRTGDEAMQYLERKGIFKDAVTPDLVLLDLNVPKLGGFPVLEQLKDLRFTGEHVTAVVVWSGSVDQKNKDAAYVLGADEFFVKGSPGTAEYDELVGYFRASGSRMSSGAAG